MAQKGLLTKKREQLEIWGAISVRPLPEDAERIVAGDQEQGEIFYQAVQFYVADILAKTLAICMGRLAPSQVWEALAASPDKFDARLKLLSKGTERCMKLLYEIPDRRPTRNEERDMHLARLREAHPDLTYGQLAIKFNGEFAGSGRKGVTPAVFERAVVRLQGRTALQIQRVLAAAAEYRKTHGLSDDEVLERLPTPEQVLDLLTSD
jgi:hypothetical protein